jgi:hypothetical protein
MRTKPIVNLADVPLRDFPCLRGEARACRPFDRRQEIGVPVAHRASRQEGISVSRPSRQRGNVLHSVGAGTYRVGAESFPIRANDVVAAPAGDGKTAHQIVNTGRDELRYLAISTRNDPDVAEYPDSGKFALASMLPEDKGLLGARVRFIGRMDTPSLGYLEGEE